MSRKQPNPLPPKGTKKPEPPPAPPRLQKIGQVNHSKNNHYRQDK